VLGLTVDGGPFAPETPSENDPEGSKAAVNGRSRRREHIGFMQGGRAIDGSVRSTATVRVPNAAAYAWSRLVQFAMNLASPKGRSGLPHEIEFALGQPFDGGDGFVPAATATASRPEPALAVIHCTHPRCGSVTTEEHAYRQEGRHT
jgi:hypothetical protein